MAGEARDVVSEIVMISTKRTYRRRRAPNVNPQRSLAAKIKQELINRRSKCVCQDIAAKIK